MIKNVIIVNDYATLNGTGGATKVAIQSAIGLAKHGINVVFFCAVGPIDEELVLNTQVICIEQSDILNEKNRFKAFFQGIWNVKAKKIFQKILCSFDSYDTIIHVHSWTKALSSSFFSVIDKRFKIYVTLHDYFCTCPNGAFYNYVKCSICRKKPLSMQCVLCQCDKRNYLHKIYRVMRQVVQNKYVMRSDSINYIYISETNRKAAQKWLPGSKKFFKVINPITLYTVKDSTIKTGNSFLFIGRLTYEKGIDLFCNAIEIVKANAIVIGDGEMKKHLQKKYKNIKFTGWLTHEQIEKYLLNAHALIFPSRWYEGAPLTIIETLSAYVPCIVSNCTSATEVIEDDVNGYIFKNNDLDDLCKAIMKLTLEKNCLLKKYSM